MTRYHAKLPEFVPMFSLLMQTLFTIAGVCLLGYFLWLGWQDEMQFGVLFTVFAIPAAAYLLWSGRRLWRAWCNRRLRREAELAVLSQPIPPRQPPQGKAVWALPSDLHWQILRFMALAVGLFWACRWAYSMLLESKDVVVALLLLQMAVFALGFLKWVLDVSLPIQRLVYDPATDELTLSVFRFRHYRWQELQRRNAGDFIGIACVEYESEGKDIRHHQVRLVARSGSADWTVGRVGNLFSDHYFVWQRAEKMATATGLPLLQEA